MSEEPKDYVTEAIAMMGAGYDPAVEIEAPRTVMHRRNGRTEEIERAAFVKISTAFKKEMCEIDEIALKVWLYIALSVNRNSNRAHPGLRTIAEDCGFAVNTVRAAVDRLENKYNLLTVYRDEKKYNIYEPVEFVSAKKETVSPDDTDAQTVSDTTKTVSAKRESVSPRMILNQNNQNKPDYKNNERCPIVAAIDENKIDYKRQYAILGQTINEWKSVHDEKWIIKAVKMSPGKHLNYVDTILRNWETDGYPPERKAPPAQRQTAATRAQSDFQRTMQQLQEYAAAD